MSVLKSTKAAKQGVENMVGRGDRQLWSLCQRTIAGDEAGRGQSDEKTTGVYTDAVVSARAQGLVEKTLFEGVEGGAGIVDVLADVERGIGRIVRGLPQPVSGPAA